MYRCDKRNDEGEGERLCKSLFARLLLSSDVRSFLLIVVESVWL